MAPRGQRAQREEEKEQPRATVAPDGAQHVTQARGGCGPLGIGRRHSIAPLEAGNGEEPEEPADDHGRQDHLPKHLRTIGWHPKAKADADKRKEDDEHRLGHTDGHALQPLRRGFAHQCQKRATGDERADAIGQRGDEGEQPAPRVTGRTFQPNDAQPQERQRRHHQHPAQPDHRRPAQAKERSIVGQVARPQAKRRQQIAQGDEQADRCRRDAKVNDEDAVPDAGDEDVAHRRADLEAAEPQAVPEGEGSLLFVHSGRIVRNMAKKRTSA